MSVQVRLFPNAFTLKKEGFEPPKEFLIELQSTAFDRSAISSKD